MRFAALAVPMAFLLVCPVGCQERPGASSGTPATATESVNAPAEEASSVAAASATGLAGKVGESAEGGGPPNAGTPRSSDAGADAARDVGQRDKRLKACCATFGPYSTGAVADRGPNLSHIEQRCVTLWRSGATLGEAEPELARMAKKARWYLLPVCRASGTPVPSASAR